MVVGCIGIIERMLVPLTPVTGPDSIGYLGVAFRFMTNGLFSAIAERSYLYSGFLTLIIIKSKDVANIVLFQRVFSILSSYLFYKILKITYFEFNISKIDYYKIYKPLSVFFSVLIIFSPSQNYFDQCMHPESLTLPFVFLLTYGMLKFYKHIASNRTLFILLWFVFTFITNYFICVLQPRMTLGCFFIDIVLLFFLFKIHKAISIKLIFLVIPLCMIIMFNHIKVIHKYSRSSLVKCQRYASLFYYNLNTISKLINEDLNDPNFNQVNKNYLRKVLKDYEDSKKPQYIGYSSGQVPTIGYNTDYMSQTYKFLLQQKGETPKKVTDFYQYYLYKAIQQNSIDMTAKILKEFSSYYTTGVFFEAQNNITSINLYWKESLVTITTWPAWVISNKVYLSYIEKLQSSIGSNYKFYELFYKLFSVIFISVNYLFLPILIAALITFFYNYIIRKKVHEFGTFLFLLIIYHNLIILTISIGASTTYARYVFDMFPATFLVFAFSLIYIIYLFPISSLKKRLIKRPEQ